MQEYSFTEARQNFAAVLETAQRDGAVGIQQRPGDSFRVKPATAAISPLEVAGIALRMKAGAIVESTRAGRERAG